MVNPHSSSRQVGGKIEDVKRACAINRTMDHRRQDTAEREIYGAESIMLEIFLYVESNTT